MSEYEIANLALQQATITAGYWQTGITLAVSSSLVLYGFRVMRRSSDMRSAELQADREDRSEQHAEAMRVSERRHTEAMRVSEERHTEAMKASEERHIEAMKALQALIERTAPPG